MDSIVAVDIETTGLDPEKDSIIEIGAVRFNLRRVEREWSTLINPGRRIPPYITQLTGINDQMVLQAPPIQDVIAELDDFVGFAPVLGHNVRFDLAFLRRQGLFHHNDTIDTYEMASVLLPEAGRYNLSALAQNLGVLLPATHRALDDAQATRGIFLRLYDELMQLPIRLLAEITRLSESVDWGGYWVFQQALRARSQEVISPREIRKSYLGPLFDQANDTSFAPLQPVEQPLAIDPEETAAILEHGGAFSRHFPHFEHRPEQVAMVHAVAEALSEGRHLLVEAGTGTGKSMAYLVPAALWSTHNNTRVVISTNTINLQDQLIGKDIPDLRDVLGLDLRAAILKGRSNYICPRRLESLRRRGPESPDEMRVLGKVMVWLERTNSGDRSEINLNGPVENDIWRRLSAEDENCTAENCLKHTGGNCPFYRSRQAAQSAHLLIVNHALLLADVATGSRVIPEYDTLIVDEAHHLEDAVTNALSFRAMQGDVDRMLRELGGPSAGNLGWLVASSKNNLPPSDYASLNQLIKQTTDTAFQIQNLVRQFFITIDKFLFEQRDRKPVGPYGHQERILPATRTQPAWTDVEVAWENAQRKLQNLMETLAKILQEVADRAERFPEEDIDLYNSLSNLYRRFKEFAEKMDALVFVPEPDMIYWAEVRPNNGNVSLHAAPLHIGPLMQRHVWHEKISVILTSATLTAAGEFDYLRGRLFAEDAYELALGSPFDYESATLLYIANDIPEPHDRRGHQKAVESGLLRLCRKTGGRTLALFTSYEQLRRTSRAIAPILANDGIIVYEQGEGASPHSLLESFRSADRAVLLGTRAFWEGVDVPGEALSVLVIVKLPFDVPSDPIIASRSETFEDPFYQYALPEAILRFRQGFGRLIRTQYDRGVVAILDRRVLTKRYGRAFLDSLPTCTVRVGPLVNVAPSAEKWLNL